MPQAAARPPSQPDADLHLLFLLTRLFREEHPNQSTFVEELFPLVESLALSPLSGWDLESLARARHFAEEITIHYVKLFHNLATLPVTYYKREKAIRRHLDQEFSRLFREIIRRAGIAYLPELISEEPIYYLLQKAREKSFPKTTRGKGRHPLIETLRMRFHVALSAKLDPENKGPEDRRVLLPFEIR